MALFRVSNNRAQFDAAGNEATDQYGAGIRFTQSGNARVTTGSATNYNQGIPMSGTGQVAIVDATAGLPAGTIFHNGLPISGDKVCVSRNATAVVSNGLPYDAAGAVAGDISFDLNFIGTNTLNSSVTFTRASTATYFNSAGVLTTAAIDAPRFDYNPATLAVQGLLIEEARTNSIRNNTMQGAAAGTPGTAPTNWVISTGAGITRELVGTGTENGITYVDYKFSGTGSVDSDTVFEQGTQIAALSAQTWTASQYLKLQAGSLTNVTITLVVVELSAVGGFLAASAQNQVITSAGLATQRYQLSRTLNNALTAFVRSGVRITATGAIDITLRIGLPQLEQGAFATSVIPTTTTALTRSADVASVNTLAPWWNSAAGTFYAEFSLPSIGRAARLFAVDDGSINNVIDATVSVTNAVAIEGIAAGVYSGFAGVVNTITANTTQKAAFTFNTSASETVCLNAGTVGSNNITLPAVALTRLLLGQQANSAATLGGYLRRLTFYPRQLSNAESQAITA